MNEEIKNDIKDVIEQIDHSIDLIEQDFEENNDNVRSTIGGTYLRGQLKAYKEIRDCLEQIIEGEE